MSNCPVTIGNDQPTTISDNQSQSLPPEMPDVKYIYITATVFYALVFILGILGNALVIYVVCCHRAMSTPTNIFLLNLTIADLLVLLVCMPSALVEFHAKDVWLLGSFMCRMVPFLENAMSHTSILIILAISFERYHAINSPFEVLYACTKKRAVKIISGLWVCGLMSALPMVFISHTEQAQHVDWGVVEVCRTPIHNFWRTFYVVAIIVLFFILPGIILVVIYVSMCSKMLQDTNRQRNHSSNVTNHDILNSLKVNTFSSHHNLSLPSLTTQRIHRIRLSHKQVVYMLITIIVMFFICLIPIKVMILVGIFTSVERMERLGIEAYLNLMSFARIMFYINSAVNPVLYNIVSTKFRHAFYKSFFCVLKSPHVEHSVMNGNLPRRGHYTPYYRRSMGSKTWYSEFELYHNRSDASSGKLKDKIMATNEI